MAPDCECELIEVSLVVLALARIVIGRRYDLPHAQGGHDRVRRATGKTMEQNGPITDADRQARLTVGVHRAPAHGKITLPLSAELTDDAVRLLLDRG